jgi:broad specificity phosphatase PhoE
VADPARERALSSPDRADGAASPADAASGLIIPPDLEATIVLVRHGESTFIEEGRFQGQAETPLSSLGRRQAQRAAERLAHPGASPALPIPTGPPLEIVHSPLGRAAETAGAVATAMAADGAFGRDIPLRPDPGLLEIGQGEWEGLHHAEIEARWAEVLATWRRRPLEAWAPGGESIPVVAARVRLSLEALIGRLATAAPAREAYSEPALPRSPVAGYRGAARGGPWSVVVGHDGVFKVLLLTLFDLPLERFWMWSFDLCGFTVIELRSGRAVLRAMNLTEHLAPLLDAAAQEATEDRQRSGAL